MSEDKKVFELFTNFDDLKDYEPKLVEVMRKKFNAPTAI